MHRKMHSSRVRICWRCDTGYRKDDGKIAIMDSLILCAGLNLIIIIWLVGRKYRNLGYKCSKDKIT